jgi:hypothetical protein
MLWHSTNRETYSPEFLGVVFDLSRQTILELCASVPRVGERFEFDSLRPSWSADRQRRGLAIEDQDWVLALIAAAEYVESKLIKSSNTLRVLLQQAQAQVERISA